MGIGLVKEALLPAWAGLTPFARLALVQMASTALDEGIAGEVDARRYWGGHGFLGVMLLGIGDGDPGWPSARRRIQRAIAELIDAGAIERLEAAVNGGRAVYVLTTNTFRLPVDNPSSTTVDNGTDDGHQGDTSVALRGTPVSPSGGHQCRPIEGGK